MRFFQYNICGFIKATRR